MHPRYFLAPSVKRSTFPPILVLVLTIAGCTSSPHQAIQDEYHRDAELCRAQSPAPTTQSSLGGARTEIPPNAEVNRPAYLRCMQRLGYRQEAKTDPLLKALDRCQARALKTGRGAFDQVAFQACLKQRGFRAEAGPGGR